MQYYKLAFSFLILVCRLSATFASSCDSCFVAPRLFSWLSHFVHDLVFHLLSSSTATTASSLWNWVYRAFEELSIILSDILHGCLLLILAFVDDSFDFLIVMLE